MSDPDQRYQRSDPPTDSDVLSEFEYNHRVTSENTVMHWILYALDAWESHDPDDRRDQGGKPTHVFDYASDDNGESLVFRGIPEVRHQMKMLAEDRKALARRTDETGWHDDDVDWYYRLNEEGRKALLDLGIPEYLPNRRDPEFDRQLPMEPNHQPGWWLSEDDQPDYDVEEGWHYEDNEWVGTDYDRVYYKEVADATLGVDRNYTKLGRKLAEVFPDVTFVLTCGPYRPHDLMYRIRDPFKKVVQIDVYSPMSKCREKNEITAAFEALVRDLHHALDRAADEFTEDDDA